MKRPWFTILEIIEPKGRSVIDIIRSVAEEERVAFRDIVGATQIKPVRKARIKAYQRVHAERPDLSSTVAAKFFNREASVLRRFWKHGASCRKVCVEGAEL